MSNGLPTDGWSNAFSFRPTAKPVAYIYYPGQLDGNNGDALEFSKSFRVGSMQHFLMRVKMNTPNVADGILEAWVDGERVLSRDNMLYRMSRDVAIDQFVYTTFFGGNQPRFAPQNTVEALFEDFKVCVPQ